MRIIDADKLINQIERHCINDEVLCKADVIEIINNEPTAELTETEIQAVLNKRCMTAVTNEYLIALQNNRLTGKWLEDRGVVACSHCHMIWLYRKTNYCPNCGAKMKGAKE